ncbi:MAG: DUF1697 domain-containing protein [Bauldia sp.]
MTAPLASRVRAALAGVDFTETRMFGGVAFLVAGNMVAAASSRGLMLRLGKDGEAAALGREGVAPVAMRGKPVAGYVRLAEEGLTPASLKRWLKSALAFVATLPAKGGGAKASAKPKGTAAGKAKRVAASKPPAGKARAPAKPAKAARSAPAAHRYVALLRGINVGGNNVIRMADLRAALERSGLAEVETHIQSGNVMFSAPGGDAAGLAKRVDAALAEAFAYEARSVVLSDEEIGAVIAEAPRGFGTAPDEYRYDVVFCRPPLTAVAAAREIVAKPGVDQVTAGRHALYFVRLRAAQTRSSLPKIMALPIYQQMTIRNWATTAKLAALLQR